MGLLDAVRARARALRHEIQDGADSARIVLIAGGQAKGQDFSPLAEVARGALSGAVLVGVDRSLLVGALDGNCPVELAGDMNEAVAKAATLAGKGGDVLLSPACASQDMYMDYADRGRAFGEAVAVRLSVAAEAAL